MFYAGKQSNLFILFLLISYFRIIPTLFKWIFPLIFISLVFKNLN